MVYYVIAACIVVVELYMNGFVKKADSFVSFIAPLMVLPAMVFVLMPNPTLVGCAELFFIDLGFTLVTSKIKITNKLCLCLWVLFEVVATFSLILHYGL